MHILISFYRVIACFIDKKQRTITSKPIAAVSRIASTCI